MLHSGPTFWKIPKQKQKYLPLTAGRIPPNLKQSENHSQNIDEEAHCCSLVGTKIVFWKACLSEYQQEVVMFQAERITLTPLWK